MRRVTSSVVEKAALGSGMGRGYVVWLCMSHRAKDVRTQVIALSRFELHIMLGMLICVWTLKTVV